ncbi:MAG: type II secretion system F family protein [Clostridiales Family XIII bacterium]|jgi:hypothetical protein|nr:type II secretion system F family protein [Clostridiales Family XIII bacterium]
MNIKGKKEIINRLEAFLLERLPDSLTGKAPEMEKRYRACFGSGDFSAEIRKIRVKTVRLYALLALSLILLFGATAVKLMLPAERLTSLKRPDYGSGGGNAAARLEAEYKGERARQEVTLRILPEDLDENAKKARLKKTAGALEALILGENSSLRDLKHDLSLIRKDEETGVEIAWSMDPPEIISEEGKLNFIKGRAGDAVTLTAKLTLEDASGIETLNAVLGKPPEGRDYGGNLRTEIAELLKKINDAGDGAYLRLPAESNGVRLSWQEPPKRFYTGEILLLLAAAAIVWKNRYSAVEKRIRKARESVAGDFPEMINKLILLLNAGLVVSSAMEKIAINYEQRADTGNVKFLYEELLKMQARIRGSNASFIEELGDIARRSGVRELMRFAGVVADNIGKGSALSEKLQTESDLLWNSRKKKAEEQGRIAETKLTIPMLLMLLVLVMITIAPAALEM